MSTDNTTEAQDTTDEKHGLMDKIAGAVEHMVNKHDDSGPTIEPIGDEAGFVPASETPAGQGSVQTPSVHIDESGKVAGSV